MDLANVDPPLIYAAAAAGVLVAVLALVVLLVRRRRRRAVGASATTESGLRSVFAGARGISDRLRAAITSDGAIEERLVAVEAELLKADVGVRSTRVLLERLRAKLPSDGAPGDAMGLIASEMVGILEDPSTVDETSRPHVILVSGVNGVGKTTSVAKLAHYFRGQGRTVLLVAADTFRAAAAAQLAAWAERIDVECVRRDEGADPSAVAYEGLQQAKAKGIDVVIVDTAGRLHVKANLVAELQKIARTIGKLAPGAPHESLLVIDATTGQNASNQAKAFSEALPLSGVILTKLDGTARGGSVFAVRSELGLPIRYVGFGEGVGDFDRFDARRFVAGLLGVAEPAPRSS